LPATWAIVAEFLTLLGETGFAPQMPHRAGEGREPLARPLGPSTSSRRLVAIVFAHGAAIVDPPIHQPNGARVDKATRAIRRDKRDNPPGKKRTGDGGRAARHAAHDR
jgi:hypothetical protein